MTISKKELADLYATITTTELRERLGGITAPRLYRLLDKAGIPRKTCKHAPRNPIKIKLVD
jgi:hypothetical protein